MLIYDFLIMQAMLPCEFTSFNLNSQVSCTKSESRLRKSSRQNFNSMYSRYCHATSLTVNILRWLSTHVPDPHRFHLTPQQFKTSFWIIHNYQGMSYLKEDLSFSSNLRFMPWQYRVTSLFYRLRRRTKSHLDFPGRAIWWSPIARAAHGKLNSRILELAPQH